MEEQVNRIQEILVRKRKSQKWLANELGVTTNTVSTWCLNKHQPSVRQLVKMAKLFNIQMGDLFYPVEDMILHDE